MKKLPVLLILLAIIISGCGRADNDQFADARRYLDQGKLTSARAAIKKAVAADSSGAAALYGEAIVAEYQGFKWEALLTHLEAARTGDGFTPSFLAFIRLAIDMDRLQEARQVAKILAGRQPDDPEAYLSLARIDLLDRRLDSARVHLDRASQYLDDPVRIPLLEIEIDLHSFDDAIVGAALERLADIDCRTADHLMRRAELYHFANMGDSAIASARRAVERDRSNISNRLQLARYLYDQRYLAEASDLINDIINTAEDCGPAYLLAARIQKTRRPNSPAVLLLNGFMELDMSSPETQENFADFYLEFGDTQTACNGYESAFTQAKSLKYADDYIRVLYLKMTRCLLEAKNAPLAREYRDEGQSLFGDRPEYTLLRAEMMRFYPEVADSVELIIDRNIPANRDNRAWLEAAGDYFSRTVQPEKAATVYARLIELPQPDLAYYVGLLDACKDTEDAAAAERLADNLPICYRASRLIHERLFDVFRSAGQLEKAGDYASMLYDQSPGYLPYIMQLADLYDDGGSFDDAYRLYQTYLQNYPDDPEGYYRTALFEKAHGMTDSTLANVNRGLERDSEYDYLLELKGIYYQDRGVMDSALYYYREAINRKIQSPFAYHNMAEYFLQQGDSLNRAEGLAMAAVHYFRKDRRGYLLLGNVYFSQEKYKLARTQYFKGTRLIPDDAELHFLLGRTEAILDEKEAAKKSLKKALELNLGSPQKEEAQNLLSRL